MLYRNAIIYAKITQRGVDWSLHHSQATFTLCPPSSTNTYVFARLRNDSLHFHDAV